MLLFDPGGIVPELPEVETVARGLDDTVAGREIATVTLKAPDLYRRGSRRVAWMRGCTVRRVERIGKAILFHLVSEAQHERALVVHLGMTGRFVFADTRGGARELSGDANGDATAGADTRHRHGRWRFRDGAELYYVDPRRFGYFYLGAHEGLRATLNMGPDPFELRPRELQRILGGRSAPVKALLLNQRLISGLGNIYVDESLYRVGVHPLTPGSVAASNAGPILQTARRVLRRAIRWRGTTLRDYRSPDGGSGGFQTRLMVYGRDGEACQRCATTIEKLVVGGRGTHVCPVCQPL